MSRLIPGKAEAPSVADVRLELDAVHLDATEADPALESVDVRLQGYPDGQWVVRWGDASFDLDHRGYWGASELPLKMSQEDIDSVARELVSQVEDAIAEDSQ